MDLPRAIPSLMPQMSCELPAAILGGSDGAQGRVSSWEPEDLPCVWVPSWLRDQSPSSLSSAAALVKGLSPGPVLEGTVGVVALVLPLQLVPALGCLTGGWSLWQEHGVGLLGGGEAGVRCQALQGLSATEVLHPHCVWPDPALPARGKLPLPDPHQAEADPSLLPAVCSGDSTGAS